MAKEIRAAGVAGTGFSVPERVVTNFDLERMGLDTSDEWIRPRTGIVERHIAAEDEATSDFAVQAAQTALERARVKPEDLDLIIVGTVTPDMIFPSTSCLVQHQLGAYQAGAMDLSAACAGFVYGLSVGAQFIATGQYDTVLVIGAETLSKIVDWTDRTTCVLFGDGAGAVVLRPAPPGLGLLGTYLAADGRAQEMLKVEAGGSRQPASPETVANRQHFIKMNGREVFRYAVRVQGEACERVMEQCGVTAEDIDWFIPHQANERIIDAAAERLKLPSTKVYKNLARYGNTSAASIPIALAEADEKGLLRYGDHILMVGFGSGLTWAAGLLRWSIE